MTFLGLNNEQEAVYEIVEPSNLNTIKCSSTLANHLVLGQMELHKLKIGSEDSPCQDFFDSATFTI